MSVSVLCVMNALCVENVIGVFCAFVICTVSVLYTGCSGKIVFFHNSLQPIPRLHCCKRPLKLSAQCECTVTPIGWYFFVQPIAAECWRGRGGKLSRILGKNTILNEHPVYNTLFGVG